MKTPTAETIRTARDAAQADFLKISVEPHGALANSFYVQMQGERPYLVSPNPFADGDEDECTCGEFASAGYCRCIAAVELTRDLYRQEAEFEERCAAIGEEADALERYHNR